MTSFASGCVWRKHSSAAPKSEIVSIRAPITSSRAIIEFKENSFALWSLINLSLFDRGFGAEWIGVLSIVATIYIM